MIEKHDKSHWPQDFVMDRILRCKVQKEYNGFSFMIKTSKLYGPYSEVPIIKIDTENKVCRVSKRNLWDAVMRQMDVNDNYKKSRKLIRKALSKASLPVNIYEYGLVPTDGF
jgi:hypothetical protein